MYNLKPLSAVKSQSSQTFIIYISIECYIVIVKL